MPRINTKGYATRYGTALTFQSDVDGTSLKSSQIMYPREWPIVVSKSRRLLDRSGKNRLAARSCPHEESPDVPGSVSVLPFAKNAEVSEFGQYGAGVFLAPERLKE